MIASRSLAKILVPSVVVVVIAAGGVIYATRRAPSFVPSPSPAPSPAPSPGPSPVACTMEAKACPDGSYVGRTGPDCQFAPCPSTTPTPTPAPTPLPVPVPTPTSLDCNGPGDACPSGYTCIQKCGPPVARVGDPPPGYYCETNAIASKPRMCPICLASNAVISSPSGEIGVKDVKIGMHVWSIDANGKRIASAVSAVSHTVVPSTHQVVHLVLADGREVWVSPGHPDGNGRLVGSLRAGDVLDGDEIRSADLVPYWDRETYDLLPDSATGEYWANGILLGSTLSGSR